MSVCVLCNVPNHQYNLSARRLLFRRLGPKQSAFFIRYCCIWFRGKEGLYCISPNDSAYGTILADFKGTPLKYLCCHPAKDDIPVMDKVLMDYLHLKADEKNFRSRTIVREYVKPEKRNRLGGVYFAQGYAFSASNYWIPPPVPYWL